MKYKNVLVTGGAGFVGSHICLKLKEQFPQLKITALDNLNRKGSELNVPRLKKNGVSFLNRDVRFKKDLEIKDVDLLIECSAEPSVMAGVTSSPEYLLDTNLLGAINCFELARKTKADVIFLSTSRVYPVKTTNQLFYKEEKTRFVLTKRQFIKGASERGINEQFPIDGARTLYGTTKLSAEFILEEYIQNYGIRGVINRCGLITGVWQMGKVDQGVIVFWMARHIFRKPLSYIGFGGSGKQVRDIIDIDDLFELLLIQIMDIEKYNAHTYNVGGGLVNSVSLLELTRFCNTITKNKVAITKYSETRAGDIRIYISDSREIIKKSGWKPKKTVEQSLEEIYKWIIDNRHELEKILS